MRPEALMTVTTPRAHTRAVIRHLWAFVEGQEAHVMAAAAVACFWRRAVGLPQVDEAEGQLRACRRELSDAHAALGALQAERAQICKERGASGRAWGPSLNGERRGAPRGTGMSAHVDALKTLVPNPGAMQTRRWRRWR